jgi:hypothetical protein
MSADPIRDGSLKAERTFASPGGDHFDMIADVTDVFGPGVEGSQHDLILSALGFDQALLTE